MENLENKKFNHLISGALMISSVLIFGAMIYAVGLKSTDISKEISAKGGKGSGIAMADLEEKIIPSNGVELPIKWGDLGKQIIEVGVIDASKFESIYSQRGGLTKEQKDFLYAKNNGNIVVNSSNAGFVLNLFWALGLGNKNEILENGPMTDSKYGGANRFASTGGWSLSNGDAMEHYSKHKFINLTAEQQVLVERVSKGIYRPCCDNSVYFPDCNHGMAMLGFLELAVSQGFNEDKIYQMALVLNSYWFPDTYLTIGKYFENKGIDWEKVSAKEALGYDFSSGSGYRKILSQVEPSQGKGGGGCGV